jgi:hypothetical protein
MFFASRSQLINLLLKLTSVSEVIVKGKSFAAILYEGVVSAEVSGARSVYFI